jgi:uncharacterized protein (DUF1499 family)
LNPPDARQKDNGMLNLLKRFEHYIVKTLNDDLELFLNPSSGIISIRSAAQTGYWDFGVNRRRTEHLRHELQARDLIHHP